MVNAVANFSSWVWNVFGVQPLIDGLPGLPAIIGAKRARRGNSDVDSLRIAGIKNDSMQAHASRARLPFGASAVTAKPGKFVPILSAVGGAEKRGVFDARINGLRIGKGGLDVPDSLELPGMLRAVVPLMRGERRGGGVVNKFVALAFGGPGALVPEAFRADARSCRHHRSAE